MLGRPAVNVKVRRAAVDRNGALHSRQLRLDVRDPVPVMRSTCREGVALLGQPHRIRQDQPGRGLDMLRTVTAGRVRVVARRRGWSVS